MIEKFRICRDDAHFLAFPDVALTQGGVLACVFLECKHPADRAYTAVVCATSGDGGRTWSPKRPVSEPLRGHPRQDPYWNTPRITALANDWLVVVVDKIAGPDEGHSGAGVQQNFLFWSKDDGRTWDGPYPTAARGIAPDRLLELKTGPRAGRWLLCCYTRVNADAGARYQVRCWVSDDRGKAWRGPQLVNPAQPQWQLCEPSVCELPGGRLVCFMRENSGQGLDCFKSVSLDAGLTWEGPYPMPLPACQRPVAAALRSGRVLVTHRFAPGGAGQAAWSAQNLFAAITDVNSCLVKLRKEAGARILPVDFDRSLLADTGSSGWVQLPDGEIYVVNHLVDDGPKGQIRGYRMSEKDFGY